MAGGIFFPMNKNEKSLLVAFTGADASLSAVAYGVWLAEQIDVPVTLLGIVEKPGRQKKIEPILGSTSAQLKAAGIAFEVILDHGNSRNVIPR